jgi:hypothetical protein
MSLLSHQSSVNPTTTFWSKTAEVAPLPGQFAFVASDPNSTTAVSFEQEIPFLSAKEIISVKIPTLPYDVNYYCYCSVNLSSETDTGIFEVGLAGTSAGALALTDLRASKGWFNVSTFVVSPCEANLDGETIAVFIQNSFSGETINVIGNASIIVIGYPVIPPPE